MRKRIAVAVIHGIGSQGCERPPDSATPTYSKAMRDRVRRILKPETFDRDVAWREIFFADTMQQSQDDYLERIKKLTNYDTTRALVVRNLADAANYRPLPDDTAFVYRTIHERVSDTLDELEYDVDEEAPLIVLAHSLGGHVISNDIWDKAREGVEESSFVRYARLHTLVTFGCNIPIFTFTYYPEDVVPVRFPGVELAPHARRRNWWLNFYDPDDVLGYPLAPTSPGYQAMAEAGELRDFKVNAGGIVTCWNPMSHNAYWSDRDVVDPIAGLIKFALDARQRVGRSVRSLAAG